MKSQIAQLMLLGQYGPKKYVTKQEILTFDLFKMIEFLRTQFD